jgi:hypothetical protein
MLNIIFRGTVTGASENASLCNMQTLPNLLIGNIGCLVSDCPILYGM